MTSKKIPFTKSSGNLFKDFGFSETEARKLQFRSYLMVALMKYIQSENITQQEAAKRFGISQSRVSNLMHCRVDLFSTDRLLDILEEIGFKIYDKMEADIASAIEKPQLTVSSNKYAHRAAN